MLVIGTALSGRGGEGVALANAQTIVAGLVSTTRAQAALYQTSARLVVYAQQPPAANADAEKYLRTLQIVRQETAANGTLTWVAAGDAVTLPAPVCVVPVSPVPTNHLATGVAWNNTVATGPVSTLTLQTAGFSYSGQSVAAARTVALQYFGTSGGSGRVFYLEYAPDGTVSSPAASSTPIKIALTTAVLNPNALPLFNNPYAVRGLFVRKSGAISLVQDSTGF